MKERLIARFFNYRVKRLLRARVWKILLPTKKWDPFRAFHICVKVFNKIKSRVKQCEFGECMLLDIAAQIRLSLNYRSRNFAKVFFSSCMKLNTALKIKKPWNMIHKLFVSLKSENVLLWYVCCIAWEQNEKLYCISKKFWPILYSRIQYKIGQDFLDIQYSI